MATQHPTSLQILVAVESIDVNDSSGTKGRVALIQNLIALGYTLTVLHYTQKPMEIKGAHCVAIPENRRSWYFFMSRLQRYIYRWFGYNISERQERRNGFSYTWCNDANAFAKALKDYHPDQFDILFTFGKGRSFRPHAGVLQVPQWHSKWYAYVHDPYPQHLYPRPYNFVENGYKQKRYFFREMTEKAQCMVFPSQLLKEWMQSYFVAIKDKSLIIPHQIAELPDASTKTTQELDPTRFTLLHAGNLLDLRDPEVVVSAYQQFLKKHPEATQDSQLLFVGKPSTFDAYLTAQQAKTPSLECSDGYVAFDKVYRMQQQAQVNIILEAKSEISPFLPGKFAHCVAANAPILLIGPYYSECKRLLGPDYRYSFEFSEVDRLAEAIKRLYLDWKKGSPEQLSRPDLAAYMNKGYVKETLENSLTNA